MAGMPARLRADAAGVFERGEKGMAQADLATGEGIPGFGVDRGEALDQADAHRG